MRRYIGGNSNGNIAISESDVGDCAGILNLFCCQLGHCELSMVIDTLGRPLILYMLVGFDGNHHQVSIWNMDDRLGTMG